MLALSHADDFPQRIANSLGVPMETARALSAEVDSDIFMSIRQSLQNFSQKKAAEVPLPVKKLLEPHPADIMLSEKTISIPPAPVAAPVIPPAPIKSIPPMPANYKADPYREPIN